MRRFAGAAVLMALSCSAYSQGVLPEPGRVELDNGAVFLLIEKHDVPLIGLEAIVDGGAVTDPAGMAGMSDLVAGLIQKGAGDRSGAEFVEAIAAVGGELSASANLEGISIHGDFMARDAELMVELLADMLIRPTLAASEFAKLRERSINVIRAAKDTSLGQVLPMYGNAFLFGEHGYATPIYGSEASLARIRHRDVLGHYRRSVGPNRLTIAVVGDFETAEMASLLTAAFADWAPIDGELPEIDAPAATPGGHVLLIDAPGAAQTYFWLGKLGVAADYPWRADLDVANTLFGGRYTSKLNSALRIESGLTYGARSVLMRPSKAGSVVISSYTETATTIEAIDMAIDVLNQFRAEGIDDDMLVSAQNYILGQYPPNFETATQLASALALIEHMGLDTDYINGYTDAIAATTTDSVNELIGAIYAPPEELTYVILGDGEHIREQVAKYGTVTEVSISDTTFRVQKSPDDE